MKYVMFAGDSEMGVVQAGSEKEAMAKAKELFPYTGGLRVELDRVSTADHFNPMSGRETKSSMDKFFGTRK